MTDSPFVLSTRELGRGPGAMRQIEVTATCDHDLGNQVIAVPADSPIELDLQLESVMEGVLVTGVASAASIGECVRCLNEVNAELEVDITELFAYPGKQPQVQDDEESEPLPELDGEDLDLEATVIDALVTALPFRPLCSPTCGGLCPECGVRLDDAEPGHAHEQLDPRWSALAALAGSSDKGEEGSVLADEQVPADEQVAADEQVPADESVQAAQSSRAAGPDGGADD